MATEVLSYLSDLQYPATKGELRDAALRNNVNPRVLAEIDQMEDTLFHSPGDVDYYYTHLSE